MGGGSLEAPGTPDPKLNIDGGSKSGTYDSARLSARVHRAKTSRPWGLLSVSPSLSPRPPPSRCATQHAKGITTCSLAHSFCDGPSGAQVMPLLLADPISLTLLVNLDGKKSRLCHLSVIA